MKKDKNLLSHMPRKPGASNNRLLELGLAKPSFFSIDTKNSLLYTFSTYNNKNNKKVEDEQSTAY